MGEITTIHLSPEKFLMSPQQFILLHRYPEKFLHSDIPCYFRKAAVEIEERNRKRAFSLETTIRCRNVDWIISTDTLYHGEEGENSIERFAFLSKQDYEKICEPNDSKKIIACNENSILADLVYFICKKEERSVGDIRTIYHVFDSSELLCCHSVNEEIIHLNKIKEHVHYRLEAFTEDLETPEKELPPCHWSYSGRCFEKCIHCPARLSCEQLKANRPILKSQAPSHEDCGNGDGKDEST